MLRACMQKAKRGEIKDFTGISSPYEKPTHPELILDTGSQPLEICVDQVLDYLVNRGVID